MAPPDAVSDEAGADDPVVIATVAAFERMATNRFRDLGLAAARTFADFQHPSPPVESEEDREILGGDGQSLPIRVYRDAPDNGAVVVFLHGGGWALGSIEAYNGPCRGLCRASGSTVVSVGYRLAPENPFPAALLDAYAATQWVSEHAAELGAPDSSALVVMGDSAGGNLAAAVCQRARDLDGPQIDLQVLVYPGLDERNDHPSLTEYADAPFLDVGDIRWFRDMYVVQGAAGAQYMWPGEAPSLEGLPPALVQVASMDALRDSGAAYVDRLVGAGVEAELRSYPLYHGFLTITPQARAARAAVADAGERIRSLG